MRFWAPTAERAGGIRAPAVAGRFYPGRADQLAQEVDAHVSKAREVLAERESGAIRRGRAGVGIPSPVAQGRLVAVIAPHAGYVYSGPTAGFAYASIDPGCVDRVVLLGPAHYVPIDGIGLSSASAWRTPLGDVELDSEVAADLAAHIETVVPGDAAHSPEHSLEVQVPFLQRVLAQGWRLVPLIVGADLPGDVAAVITWCADLPRTLVVVSSDLSHYLGYEAAIAQDSRTIRSVIHRRPDSIGASDACGRYPLRGLLRAAGAQEWSVRLLDARNSGDTAGDRDRVVGYAAFAIRAAPVEESGGGTAVDDAAREAGDQRLDSATSGRSEPAGGRITPETGTAPGAGAVPEGRITTEARAALLALARRTIEDALELEVRRPRFDASSLASSDPILAEPGAAFVTLRSGAGDLLGCIGSLSARRALAVDVAERAYDAAFRDPRFPPLTRERARGMVIDVSVLTPTRPYPCAGYAELVEGLQPGTGVVVEAGSHRATFLPAVWEQLPTAEAFVAALWRKAGLAPGEWPSRTRIEVYGSEEFAEV